MILLSLIGRGDHAKAVEVLRKDLKVFSTFNEDLFKEITMLLTLQNFRYNNLSVMVLIEMIIEITIDFQYNSVIVSLLIGLIIEITVDLISLRTDFFSLDFPVFSILV